MLGGSRFLILLGAALVCSFPSVVACTNGTPADEPTESSESSFTSEIHYDDVLNLEGTALRTGLFNLVKDHRRLGYDRARDAIFNNALFLSPNQMVECNYTGILVRANGSRTPGGFNTEHTWPQSQGAEHEPAKSDLHHLFPVLGRANSARSNFPFGNVACLHPSTPPAGDAGDAGADASSTDADAGSSSSSGSTGSTAPRCSYSNGGSGLGKDAANRWAFEVRPEKRGNVARAKFYFAVRYELHIPADEEATLREWHEEDPVEEGEVKRNDAVEQLQKNRNPFVDHPEFVAKIADF